MRPSERTAATLFLKPMRCRECEERFWVQDRRIYFGAGAALGGLALLTGLVWLAVAPDEDNMPAPQIEPARPAASAAAKPHPDGGGGLDVANSIDATGPAQTAAGMKPDTSREHAPDLTDNRHITTQLYHAKAQNGDADARYRLGLLYLTGNGALQDFAEAAKWLQLAADQGHALAQYQLGLIYRAGHGVAIDQAQSYVWLNLAAAAGVGEAALARNEVMRTLSNTQLALAQKVSREWLAAHTKPKPSRSPASGAAKAAGTEADASAD